MLPTEVALGQSLHKYIEQDSRLYLAAEESDEQDRPGKKPRVDKGSSTAPRAVESDADTRGEHADDQQESVTPQEAEIHYRLHLLIGGKLGANVATFGGRDGDREAVESTYSLGGAFAAFVRVALTERWSIKSELAYTTRGSTPVVEGIERSSFDLSYIELNFAPHAEWLLPRTHERIYAHGYIGPAIGYLLKAQRDGRDLTGFKSIDFGIQAGGGLYIALPFGSLLLDIRYFLGIPDIDETDLQIKNRSASFLLGYETAIPFWSSVTRRRSQQVHQAE